MTRPTQPRRSRPPAGVPLRTLAFGTLLAAAFLLHGLVRVGRQRQLDPMDTTAYLQEAHFIAENGGPLRMVELLASGRYRFDNRQPLYPWLLSFFAVRDFAFLPRAKLLSLAAGLACFLLALGGARRLAGDLTALATGLLLVYAEAFLRLASMVACESLLALFVVGWWLSSRAALEERRWWPVAGVLAGGAFLAKGSGLLLAAAVLLTILLQRHRHLKSGWFWLFFAGFAFAAGPLLVRNVRLYGNPVHNFNAATMWLDRWSDVYRPGFQAHPPGPLDYLRTHDAGEILRRLGSGIAGQAMMLLEALHVLRLPGLEVGLPAWLGGLFVLALAAVGLAVDRHRHLRTLTLVTLALFFLAFAWYHQVVQGVRFILPLAPVMFFYAARGGVWLTRRLWGLRPCRLGLAALAALTLLYLAALPIPNPLTSYDIPPGYERLRDWIKANVAPDEPFLLGPTHIYRFEAYTPGFPRGRREMPAFRSMAELEEWLRKEGIRTVILDVESVSRRPRVLGGFVHWDARNEVLRYRPIRGWRLVERPPAPPVGYLVFRLEKSGRPVGRRP